MHTVYRVSAFKGVETDPPPGGVTQEQLFGGGSKNCGVQPHNFSGNSNTGCLTFTFPVDF